MSTTMSFEALYEQCRHACYSAVSLSEHADMEDAIQEAALEAWRSMQESPGRTMSWYITRGVWYGKNYLKKEVYRHRNREAPPTGNDDDDDETDMLDDLTIPYEDTADAAIDSVSAQELLALLDKETRKIVMLLAGGVKQGEVAEAVGVSRWTVKRRLLSAQNTLVERGLLHFETLGVFSRQ